MNATTLFSSLLASTISFSKVVNKETKEKQTITRTVLDDNFDHINKAEPFKQLYGCLSSAYKSGERYTNTTDSKSRQWNADKLRKALTDYCTLVGLDVSFVDGIIMSFNARLATRKVDGEKVKRAVVSSETTFTKAVLRLTKHAFDTGMWTDAKDAKKDSADTLTLTKNAFNRMLREEYASKVKAGIITQEQMDALLSA